MCVLVRVNVNECVCMGTVYVCVLRCSQLVLCDRSKISAPYFRWAIACGALPLPDSEPVCLPPPPPSHTQAVFSQTYLLP